MGSIFDRQAVAVNEYNMGEDPTRFLPRWKEGGISAVAIQIFSEERLMPKNQVDLWAQVTKRANMKVWLWASCSGQNVSDRGPQWQVQQFEDTRVRLSQKTIAVGACLPEVERYVQTAMAREDKKDELSLKFVRNFRDKIRYPKLYWMPLQVVVLGDLAAKVDVTDTVALDYYSWFNEGRAHLGIESYWNQSPNLDPTTNADHQTQAGWPGDRIHWWFGVWGSAGNGDKRAIDYVTEIAPYPQHMGITWWTGIDLTDDDLKVTKLIQKLAWAL